MSNYLNRIEQALPHCLTETHLNIAKKSRGKVRDQYDLGEEIILITTDRQSAFDRVLASVPYKGQVLNLTSAWWFENTRHIIDNHVLCVPHPNVTVAKKCTVFPVEFVVRGYITGTTNTSLWTQYSQGVRHYCGHHLKEGMKKNQKLETPLLTPTTKETFHDRPISAADIVAEGLMTQREWDIAAEKALSLYAHGVKVAQERGLILVDTKYEMGKDQEGNIILIDEIHTPDSSRYWLSHSYEARMTEHLEPENIDKEFLRLWFIDHCDPYQDEVLPQAPEALVLTLSSRYIQLYEMIVGQTFPFQTDMQHNAEKIQQAVSELIKGPACVA